MINTINTIELIQYKSEKAFDCIIESLLYDDIIDTENEVVLESFQDSIEKFFDKICETIRKIIESIKTSINKIVEKEVIVNRISAIEKEIKETPSFATKEVKIKDRKKRKELDKAIKFEIVKAGSVDELEKKMKKYKQQRNSMLATTSLVVTSVGALVYFILKGKSKEFEDLKKKQEETINEVQKYKSLYKKTNEIISDKNDENEQLKDEIEKLKADNISKKAKYYGNKTKKTVTKISKEVKDQVQLDKARSSALIEVLKNECSDIADEFKEAIQVCCSSENGIVKKIKTTKKSAENIKDNVKNVVNGNAKKKVVDNRKKSYSEKIDDSRKMIKKCEEELEKPNIDDRRKTSLNNIINNEKKKIAEYRKAINRTRKI